jgi:phosphate transport system protein
MGVLALALLKESLDAFVDRDPARARQVIPRDKELDAMNKQLQSDLMEYMAVHAEAIARCLSLRVVARSLERIGDHAKNVAEMVVYLCEGRDIRHGFNEGAPPGRMAVAADGN